MMQKVAVKLATRMRMMVATQRQVMAVDDAAGGDLRDREKQQHNRRATESCSSALF